MSQHNSTSNTNHVLATCGDLWAIEPHRMRAYLNTYLVRDLDAAEIDKRTGPLGSRTQQAVGVLPLYGPVTYRSSLFSAYFGGTSVLKWGDAFDAMVANPQVGAIVLDVDSPGGSVDGVPELAAKVLAARQVKPVIAVANTFMASAAYWIGSAASEVVVVPSGEVGSIGVWSMHVDASKLLERWGERVTLISAGKYKVEGNPYEPLGEEARAAIQADVDTYYDLFTAAVAEHRGVTPKAVRSGYGEGRMLTAKAAVEAGLADRIGTLDDVVRTAAKKLGRQQAEERRRELEALGVIKAQPDGPAE